MKKMVSILLTFSGTILVAHGLLFRVAPFVPNGETVAWIGVVLLFIGCMILIWHELST